MFLNRTVWPSTISMALAQMSLHRAPSHAATADPFRIGSLDNHETNGSVRAVGRQAPKCTAESKSVMASEARVWRPVARRTGLLRHRTTARSPERRCAPAPGAASVKVPPIVHHALARGAVVRRPVRVGRPVQLLAHERAPGAAANARARPLLRFQELRPDAVGLRHRILQRVPFHHAAGLLERAIPGTSSRAPASRSGRRRASARQTTGGTGAPTNGLASTLSSYRIGTRFWNAVTKRRGTRRGPGVAARGEIRPRSCSGNPRWCCRRPTPPEVALVRCRDLCAFGIIQAVGTDP